MIVAAEISHTAMAKTIKRDIYLPVFATTSKVSIRLGQGGRRKRFQLNINQTVNYEHSDRFSERVSGKSTFHTFTSQYTIYSSILAYRSQTRLEYGISPEN
jgi:hypothetical protein